MQVTAELNQIIWPQRFARQQIFNVLQRLQGSGLSIQDPEGCYFFGDRESPLQADLRITNPSFYLRLLTGGSIGAAETWVEEYWTSSNLTNLIRVFARSLALLESIERRSGWIRYPVDKLRLLLTRNSKRGSRANIAAHYDIGNEMYEQFLDSSMQYSSAIFAGTNSDLGEAQLHKMRLICEKLLLHKDDHLLEIGTGWGSLAILAAKEYGCRVTTTTVSEQQYQYVSQRIKQEGLQHLITLLQKDYRDLSGRFDKIVSIEMIEAVGHSYLPGYFATIDRLLKPQGRLVLQAITIADQRYDQYRKSVDFIQRYIFPGGCLPSISEISRHIKTQTELQICGLSAYGQHYAKTVQHWSRHFSRAARRLEVLGYDKDFQRLWQFYFAYCEAGFIEETIDLIHIEAKKLG